MSRARLGLVASLRRASLVPSLVVAFAFCYVVSADLLSGEAVGRWRAEADPQAEALRGLERLDSRPSRSGWRPGYQQRFPGCVPVDSWPDGLLAPTVVVVRRSGKPQRLAFEDAYARAQNQNHADDVWVVGACR